jgi:hypothetical protein
MDFMTTLMAVVLITSMSFCVYVSTLIIEERKKAFRDGTHDYYGNKIEDDNE